MAKRVISRTYRNPTWRNIEVKDSVEVDLMINYEDGSTHVMNATVGISEDPDSDWAAIMAKFTTEQIDEATTDAIQRRNIRREEEAAKREEQDRRDAEFRKQEMLFAAKLESFEIPVVKDSTDRATKALIRKAKSIAEINAYTTILIMKEMENAAKVAAEEPPSATTE